MRGNVGENRPKLPSHEPTVIRRHNSRTTRESDSKFVFKEHAQTAVLNSTVQLMMATVSSGNPDAKSFPQKISRTKKASAVDALRCTQIPEPKKQRWFPQTFAAKPEADRRIQNEDNHLDSRRTKSTKAKSLSLIGDVTSGCRIPEPTKHRASFDFDRKSIGEFRVLQPEGKATCKSVLLLKTDSVSSQRKQVKSHSSRTPVVPVNKSGHTSVAEKAPRLPNAGSDRVCQSCVSTSSSKLYNVNSPNGNSLPAFASGKEASNSSSYTVLQSSTQPQASQERLLKNSNNSPSVGFLLPDRANGISLMTPGVQRRSSVQVKNSLEGSSISGKRFSGQSKKTKAFSLAKSIRGPVLAEPCIEIKCWPKHKQAEQNLLSRFSEIEIIPHNTSATTPTGLSLRDSNSFNHDDLQTTESHWEQECCTSDCFPSKDDEHSPSDVLMAPNGNILKLDLENDSPLKTPVGPFSSCVFHKTSNVSGKDSTGKESRLSAKQTFHPITKIAPENMNFAASSEDIETRSSKNITKNELHVTANASSSSVLSTFSDFISKRSSNSRATSVGIHDSRKDVSPSRVQTMGNLKKCPRVKREELLKEGVSAVTKARPLVCSSQSNKTSDLRLPVKEKELAEGSLPPKIKPDPNINRMPDHMISDQLKSDQLKPEQVKSEQLKSDQDPHYQQKNSKTIKSPKHPKYLQPKDDNSSTLQRKGGEEEIEVKNQSPEIQNRDEEDFSTTASANHSHKEAEAKTSKFAESYKGKNAKTSMSEKEGHKLTDVTNLWSDRQEPTELLSPKQCNKQSDTQETQEFIGHKEAYSRKLIHETTSQEETNFKKVTFEDKSRKRADSRRVTFENEFHMKTEFVMATSWNEFHGETKPRIETTTNQNREEKNDPQHSSSEEKKCIGTLSESVTSENPIEKDFEIVVLKSQLRQNKYRQKEVLKGENEKKNSLPGHCLRRRDQKPIRRTNPTKTANLPNLLAVMHGDNSGRQVVPITGKLATAGGCPFKRLCRRTGSEAKSLSTTSKQQTAKSSTQIKESSIKGLKQGLGYMAELQGMEEELETLVKEFKALEEGGDLLSSSSEYDSDTSLPLSSLSSSPSAATSSSIITRPDSRRLSVVRDEGSRLRWSTAKFYKFLPVLSLTQKLFPRIPQNKKDPGEWLRAQTALDVHREATRQQPKRSTSVTSYLSPSSNTTDDPLDSFVRTIDVAATPNRYPKTSDIRFNESSNRDLCAVNAADSPNFWATLFVEMPTRTNTTVYNIKIELACCALRSFFDPCDRIRFAYVRSVREKLTELIQDGLARPKFDEFVCCERYDCVLVLSLDAGALLRHAKTCFVYSLSAVLELEPGRVLVLVSTDS